MAHPAISRSTMLLDVWDGLSRPQKELPSQYFYDELGSALFDAITCLPEYGLTRADGRLLARIAADLPPGFGCVAELGSGAGRKLRPLLAAQRAVYRPIDLSRAALEQAVRELSGLTAVEPVHASYLDGLRRLPRGEAPLLLLFVGSTIGNFAPGSAREFLAAVRGCLRPGDALLIGFDLVKPVAQLLAAYDDPAGVTAAFNRNILGHCNRALGADFVLQRFAHEARWTPAPARIEMHLRSETAQAVAIGGRRFHFAAGETIWTESSHKFELRDIAALAAGAGFRIERIWRDEEWPFVEALWLPC
jgi:dimethylhistidine N-methyltransferase